MSKMAKVFLACLIFTVSTHCCCGSAIPIWEFLTRNEKMSYLYSTFAQLVSGHCKATAYTSSLPVNQCKHNLLAYGYEKLQTFSDQQLEALDPYQRGASELIWSSIMRDHPSARLLTTRKALPTPPASSLIILTHQQAVSSPSEQHQQTSVTTPAAAAFPAATASELQRHQNQQRPYGSNPIFETADAEHHHKYAMDMDIAYGYPGVAANPSGATFSYKQPQVLSSSTATTQAQPQQKTFLTGPLVFRVRPDGTPVEEDQHKPLPRDDDLDEYRWMATRMEQEQEGSSFSNNKDSEGRQHKYHRVATISALKQQHLATLALQQQLQPPVQQLQPPVQQLQPPVQQQRSRRRYQVPVSQPLDRRQA